MESTETVNNIKKKTMAKIGAKGIRANASGYTMKAKPGPVERN